MKNTFGNSISITLFGESHGEKIGAVIDGLCPGISINEDFIEFQLTKRRPFSDISTKRTENDEFEIISGVFNGKTTGAPLCIIIKNNDVNSSEYEKIKDLPRPSHVDYTANIKYHGFEDYRGGGHLSGRLTAPLVAAGSIIIQMLENNGIKIATHVKKCGNVSDKDITENDIEKINNEIFAVIDEKVKSEMISLIEKTAKNGDSIGGTLETIITGVPLGIGEPWFDSVESVISKGMFSIPSVKGIEFGLGFSFSDHFGSEVNDEFSISNEKIITKTNNNGGVLGGISNGMPILFRTAIKPTPSIFKEQNTVNLSKMQEETLKLNGRHDPAIFHRARVVADSIAAFSIADLISLRYGTDWFFKEKK